MLSKKTKYGLKALTFIAVSYTHLDVYKRQVLGGVTVGNADIIKEIYLFSRNTGPALSPFNAWILSLIHI